MNHEYGWILSNPMSKDKTTERSRMLFSIPVDVAQEAVVLNANSEPPMQTSKSQTFLKYEDEWKSLVVDDLELVQLRSRASEGGLRASRFRSVAWRLLLGALTPGSPHSWVDEVESARRHYGALRTRLRVAPQDGAEPQADNPLSQCEQSTWHQYFCDRDLKNLIRQDVVRTFPGVDFFRGENVQEVMINVLFSYARENPAMCYRQGMHEVLAPVVFVVHCDQQALLHTQEQTEVSPDIAAVLDSHFLEEDSYTLFRRIMNAIEGSYLIPNMAPTSTGYFPPNVTPMISSENQVVSQLNWIKERVLAPNDPQLFQHLESLDIPLHLFGIRWLRLLFGREFPLQDLLVLWDAIFADSSSFDLVNYIVVSMLVAIRSTLLKADYTACLTQLMRYPGSMDVSIIIDYALHLKAPKKYSPPPKMVPPKMPMTVGGRPDLHRAPQPPASQRKKQTIQRSRNPKTGNEKRVIRVPVGGTSTAHVAQDVVEGYKLNDPEVLMTELMNSYALMSLCRLKLTQYHRILEASVQSEDFEVQQALTGIHELCSLLRVRRLDRVERGTEADENPTTSSEGQKGKKTERKPSVDMTIFKQVEIPVRETSPT